MFSVMKRFVHILALVLPALQLFGMLTSVQAQDWERVTDLRGQWKFMLGDDAAWSEARFDDAGWGRIFVPSSWEDEGYPGYDGFAWFRTTFTVPAGMNFQPLYLRLGFSVIGETETHFWMRKEGHAAEFLPARWETRRCFLTEITPDAEEMLTTMFSENPELLEQYRPGVLPQEAAADIAVQRPLPPGGVIWRDRAYLVRELESRETCGFVVLYFGYPTPETVYIRSMYLRPYCRGTGMGRQLLAALEEQALALGFREARVMVGLKDWSALRFWTGCGFGRIARLKDAPESENGLANVELMKTLTVPAEK